MTIIKLEPAKKTALWGGRRLIEAYGKNYDGEALAETWELSAHPDGMSVVASGDDRGMTLPSYINTHGREILGRHAAAWQEFPILIKLIDAKKDLSVQVHPDDAYAKAHETQTGKTEMWVVLEAEEGARLILGCKRTYTREEVRAKIEAKKYADILNEIPVKKGDVYFIPAGTIHAIGAGIVVAEIQQNSDVTYRMYDYDRLGADGKPRELHLDKALDVASFAPPPTHFDFKGHDGLSESFAVDILSIRQDAPYRDTAGEESFVSLLVTEGEGEVGQGRDVLSVKKGDSLFVPAASGDYRLIGNMTVIKTVLP